MKKIRWKRVRFAIYRLFEGVMIIIIADSIFKKFMG